MTPKEADKILEMFLHKQCDLKRTEFAYDQSEVWLAVKTANDALEKQIPKKVNISIKGTTGWNTKCHCPNCRSFLSKGKYCSECGQAIDWS